MHAVCAQGGVGNGMHERIEKGCVRGVNGVILVLRSYAPTIEDDQGHTAGFCIHGAMGMRVVMRVPPRGLSSMRRRPLCMRTMVSAR